MSRPLSVVNALLAVMSRRWTRSAPRTCLHRRLTESLAMCVDRTILFSGHFVSHVPLIFVALLFGFQSQSALSEEYVTSIACRYVYSLVSAQLQTALRRLDHSTMIHANPYCV